MKNIKDDLKKAGEKNIAYNLRDQLGKKVELSVQSEKYPEYTGSLRCVDDLGITVEWSDKKCSVFRFFQWKDIQQISWNQENK